MAYKSSGGWSVAEYLHFIPIYLLLLKDTTPQNFYISL